MNTDTHPAIARYLRDLERALRDLPSARRREIVEAIREHIQEASVLSVEPDDAHVRTVLDQVGDPETIADEARQRFGITQSKAGTMEAIAIALLLVGGLILPAVGWVLGAVLLCVSRVWTPRDKLIGTLIFPGGLALPVFLFLLSPIGVTSCITELDGAGSGTCTSQPLASQPWGVVLMVVMTLSPVATAIYLGRRAFSR